MSITEAGLNELAAPETGTAWLVLLTLEHPGLDRPIRVTSDGVATLSNGVVYDPFPFEVTLPDDVEGRAPQARLSRYRRSWCFFRCSSGCFCGAFPVRSSAYRS